jgi:hypothetical protein
MVWVFGIGIGLLLLFAFPKQMGAVILLILLAGVGLFGFLHLQDRQRAEEYRKREESIALSAAYGAGGCSAEYPILITIRNGYTQTIESLTFELGGYREGYSSPLYQGLSYKSDRIIAPGDTYAACWTQPSLYYGAQEVPPAGLTWRASYSYAAFGKTP